MRAVRTTRIGSSAASEVAQQLKECGVSITPLPWYKGAFLFPAEQNHLVQQSPAVAQGLAIIQNPSSYLPVLALEPEAGDRYLDVCCAPGLKASLFAQLAQGVTELWLNEFKSERVQKLKSVLKMLEIEATKILNVDGRRLAEPVGEKRFNKILVDAECSSEAGVNFASNAPLKGWSVEQVTCMSHLQAKLALRAYDLLEPGGILVYSTCTFAPEENEGTIDALLTKHPEALVQKLTFNAEKTSAGMTDWDDRIFSPQVRNTLRVHPSDYMEGFFVARIYKPCGDEIKDTQARDAIVNLDTVATKYTEAIDS